MKILQIAKQITINAPAEKVWTALFDNHLNKAWLGCFSEGCYAETDWQLGSKVIFGNKDGNGIVGKITTRNYLKQLAITFNGFISNNQEDTKSEMAKLYNGAGESYTLTASENSTILAISSDMGADYYEQMLAAWDEALAKIKSIAEA